MPDRFCLERKSEEELIVRDIAKTAAVLASIAIAIVLVLMTPKNFGFDSSHPVVEAGAPK